jgi:hypothetical protein
MVLSPVTSSLEMASISREISALRRYFNQKKGMTAQISSDMRNMKLIINPSLTRLAKMTFDPAQLE